jgi:purine-nucleoside phosphorylase
LLDADAWKRLARGEGFRDDVYSSRLQDLLLAATQASGVRGASIARGTRGAYAQVTGPCYETPAEIRALRALGADAVGMSTAVEIEHAHGLGLECAALSCITNRAAGLGESPIHHGEVLAAVQAARSGLIQVIERFVTKL